jgi:hypothetical protein
MKLTEENRSTRGKTCPSAILSTTNPSWTDPGSNPGLRGGKLTHINELYPSCTKPFCLEEVIHIPRDTRMVTAAI